MSPSPVPRTHVERFSTPEARAAKIERETTEKLASDSNNAEIYNERALARLRLQKFAEAFSDLQNAVKLNPKNAEYQANLGYVLWKLGRGREAIEAERQALKLDDKNYTANYQLGRFLLRTGDKKLLPEAAGFLKKALEIDPRQYEVRFELIAAFREIGDTASALSQLELLQDAKPSDARVVYVSGLLSLDKGDTKTAIERLTDAVRKDPNLYGAWQDLGLLYAKLNRWNDAVNTFAELSKRQQDSAETAYFYSLSLYNTKRYPEAETEIRRALRLNGSSAEAHTLLGIILAARGTAVSDAIDSLSQAVALEPNNFDANFYLGRVQYLNRDFANAAKSLQTAVSLAPKNIEARFYLGTVFETLNESDKALAEYQEIVKLDEKSFFGQVGSGAVLLKQGKVEEAIAALTRAINLDKESFEANWTLGRAFILLEKFTEAEGVLRKAISLQPNRTDARYQLGIALRRLGKTEEARREFETVDKLNKEFREGKNP
jgi:tetratricopeptide (TPR) repeat protein